jgi:hypothetical protein
LKASPTSEKKDWHTIYNLFRDFNEDHPGENMFPGGLWLSMGFLMDKKLQAWEVDISEMKFIMKTES